MSRFECVSGLSVYWPIIALGTRKCGVAKLCRDPTVQSEFFLRVSLLKTFEFIAIVNSQHGCLNHCRFQTG